MTPDPMAWLEDDLDRDGPVFCTETLASEWGILTCQITGPHAENRHEAQCDEEICAWETGSGEYTVSPILTDEWDDADSNAYQDRVEAGLEPEGSDG